MKKLPIGHSDFKRLREDDLYYVDKSLFIKEVIDGSALIQLIPRPRRFGKTLNLSTLYYFFNSREADENRGLFEGLKICKAGAEYTQMMGKYPVIFLSFKDAKNLDKESCFEKIFQVVRKLYKAHDYLLTSHSLTPDEEVYFNEIITMKASRAAFEVSLENLLLFLHRCHGEKVVILIDEYDAPIHGGYNEGYYKEVVSFMRNFLSGGLKDTSRYLQKAVLTGILRVAQESIFSGLNNIGVYTLLDEEFSSCFGFTEAEVARLLADYALESRYEGVKEWYNGYVFGNTTIYNPWSIISFAAKKGREFKPFWINTSDNKLIDTLLTGGGQRMREEIAWLLEGNSLLKPVDENIVFPDLERKENLLWSFLLFGGYLKQERGKEINQRRHYFLSIPNREVARSYRDIIESYFSGKIHTKMLTQLMGAFQKGEMKSLIKFFRSSVLTVLSYHDLSREPEYVYHAFTAGLLIWLYDTHEVRSNRESGYGRADILLIPRDVKQHPGYIIEFKTYDEEDEENLEETIASAFAQIKEKQYETELADRGVTKIHKLAMAFKGKEVIIKAGE